MRAAAVCVVEQCGKMLEHGEAAGVSVELENRPIAGSATVKRRPVERVAGQRQARKRLRAVAVVAADQRGKLLEQRIAAAVRVDLENGPRIVSAAFNRRPIQRAAG